MAQVTKQIQNNFIAGLKTEYTGLNFPDNAATDSSNCTYSLIGDVSRRGGIDYEAGATQRNITTANVALNSYKWNNVGGDGQTQIVAMQEGGFISFFLSSAATITSPLSTQLLAGQAVSLSTFVAAGGSIDTTKECQFADGNGYLFVFHPSCDPFYCTFNSSNNTITAAVITIQIRDFAGLPDNLSPTARPSTLSKEHLYNLINQGWASSQTAWNSSSSNTNTVPSNNSTVLTWTIGTGLPIHVNDVVSISAKGGTVLSYTFISSGTVQSYAAGSGIISILCSSVNGTFSGFSFSDWIFGSSTQDLISQFQNAAGGFPSNSDVWWLYKNSTGLFDPSHLLGTVTISGPAPQGSVILNAFNQQRNGYSGGSTSGIVSGTTDIKTTVRPKTGTWFQGRVWYSGVDANQQLTGDAPYTTWTENIYFSQIVQGTADFGLCYQTNDPTAETTFDLLPSDGGVIVIQGSGSVYKLFPVQNGLLVFAANGIWFITGSTGIGFTANDYTVTKISGIHSISGTSFVNVLGWPYFWNLEGIYTLVPSRQGGGIEVENLTLGNILSFYQDIPLSSKLYAHGDYDPINYQLQWCYRSTTEAGISNRYTYDSLLVHNTIELPRENRGQILGKVFYPYTVDTTLSNICGVIFVQNPSVGSTVPEPLFKYLTVSLSGFTFSEENNFSTFTDWKAVDGTGIDAAAHAITGYNLKPQHHPYYQYYAQALVKHSVSYINVFIRNSSNNSYLFNAIWDWAISGDSGKFSSQQQVTNNLTSAKYAFLTRRHRIRGRGYSLQLKFASVPGQPMDIIGWSIFEHILEAP